VEVKEAGIIKTKKTNLPVLAGNREDKGMTVGQRVVDRSFPRSFQSTRKGIVRLKCSEYFTAWFLHGNFGAMARFDWVGGWMNCNCQGTGEVWMVGNMEQAAVAGNLGLIQPRQLCGTDTLVAQGNN
jgi:hypothetical protein